MVDIAALMADGFSSPASCQSLIVVSPAEERLSILLVIAIMMTSEDRELYLSELIITAGRFLVVD